MPELPNSGRNGQIKSFTYAHTDGRRADVRMKRIVSRTANVWEVLPDYWFIYEAGWELVEEADRG